MKEKLPNTEYGAESGETKMEKAGKRHERNWVRAALLRQEGVETRQRLIFRNHGQRRRDESVHERRKVKTAGRNKTVTATKKHGEAETERRNRTRRRWLVRLKLLQGSKKTKGIKCP